MCKFMRTVRVNGVVQFTFFLVMRLNDTIVTSCESLIVILVPLVFSSLKVESGLKNHVLLLPYYFKLVTIPTT